MNGLIKTSYKIIECPFKLKSIRWCECDISQKKRIESIDSEIVEQIIAVKLYSIGNCKP